VIRSLESFVRGSGFFLTAVAPLFLLLPAFSCAQAGSSTKLMKVPGGQIEITLPEEPLDLSTDDLLAWVKTSATAVAGYYGRFPVPHLTLRIRAGNGAGVGRGVTYPTGGGLIFISVGKHATMQALKNDWVLTHEMIHLAFPSMKDRHHWIEEGLSTYVEPVARAQIGELSVDEVWRQFIRDMPKGQPDDDDQGLDRTPTWGRTYWGGAMFCLLADVRIRERTHNRQGLREALRAILNHGGVISEDWEIKEAFAIGDKATHTRVLEDLYEEMREKPVTVNLDQLWDKLGVALKDREVVFNDQAPETAIRRAITASPGITRTVGN
jgi:hypothetical protein